MDAKVTRKMVALKAGVSEQTVSYILNGTRKFSKKTTLKVEEAIRELNYEPDPIAKSLKTKKTNTVAIIVDDIENPIFPSIIKGFQNAAHENKYSVYIASVLNMKDLEEQVSKLISLNVEGVYISLPLNEQVKSIIYKFNSVGIKIVLGNKATGIDFDIPIVKADFDSGMKQILTYLKDKGHTNIAYLSGLDVNYLDDVRCSSYVKYYKELFNLEPRVIENTKPYHTTVEAGKKLAEKCLNKYKDTTCMIATNDIMAFGAVDYCYSIKKVVGKEISIFGIDNIDFSKYLNPALTTLAYDFYNLGQETFKALYTTINQKDFKPITLISTYIIERNTVNRL